MISFLDPFFANPSESLFCFTTPGWFPGCWAFSPMTPFWRKPFLFFLKPLLIFDKCWCQLLTLSYYNLPPNIQLLTLSSWQLVVALNTFHRLDYSSKCRKTLIKVDFTLVNDKSFSQVIIDTLSKFKITAEPRKWCCH